MRLQRPLAFHWMRARPARICDHPIVAATERDVAAYRSAAIVELIAELRAHCAVR
jgi:hypothetical protein